MKKVRLFIHHHRLVCCFILLFGFLFYLSYSVYQKEDLWGFEKILKDGMASIENVFTPKVDVNYQNVVDLFTNEKEEELKKLKELLNLESVSSFELEHASVINREVFSYFHAITIDKGKNHGIDKGMLAINEQGLIGIVEYVTKNTASIKLLTVDDATFKVAVSAISGENIYNGVITGYDDKTGDILVTSIRSQSEISIGSIIKTNGLGNLYPEGIIVGTVREIEMDAVGVSKILRVKSDVDFRNIKYASIIKGVKS